MIFLSSFKESAPKASMIKRLSSQIPLLNFHIAVNDEELGDEETFNLRIAFPENIEEVQSFLGSSDRAEPTDDGYKTSLADIDAAKVVWEQANIQDIQRELGSFGKLARRTWSCRNTSLLYHQDLSAILGKQASWWIQPKLIMLLRTYPYLEIDKKNDW
jgi:hypothetical protein